MKAYNVYLRNKLIDTVFWVDNSDAEEVKQSLINHDNYHPSIIVIDVQRAKHHAKVRLAMR